MRFTGVAIVPDGVHPGIQQVKNLAGVVFWNSLGGRMTTQAVWVSDLNNFLTMLGVTTEFCRGAINVSGVHQPGQWWRLFYHSVPHLNSQTKYIGFFSLKYKKHQIPLFKMSCISCRAWVTDELGTGTIQSPERIYHVVAEFSNEVKDENRHTRKSAIQFHKLYFDKKSLFYLSRHIIILIGLIFN